jgi:hypothetical protein
MEVLTGIYDKLPVIANETDFVTDAIAEMKIMGSS